MKVSPLSRREWLASLGAASAGLALRGRAARAQTAQDAAPAGLDPAVYESEDACAEELRRRLDRSIERRMMSDVPFGVFLSGGVKQDDDQAVLRKVRLYMESGATGVMFGRNMWLRDFDHAVALTRQVHPILRRHSR